MRRRNCIGRDVARLRSEQNWTQKILAARLQCKGADISRETLAKIELGHTKVTDELILALQKVFRLPIIRLFPKAIQEQDGKFAKIQAAKSPRPRSLHAKG